MIGIPFFAKMVFLIHSALNQHFYRIWFLGFIYFLPNITQTCTDAVIEYTLEILFLVYSHTILVTLILPKNHFNFFVH
jgi:hypothetical protein